MLQRSNPVNERSKAIRFRKNGVRINFVNDFKGLLVQCANAPMRLYEVYITSALNCPCVGVGASLGVGYAPPPPKGGYPTHQQHHTGIREMEH